LSKVKNLKMTAKTIFISGDADFPSSEIESLLSDWGYVITRFTNIDSAWSLLSGESPPEIFLFQQQKETTESIIFLETIWDTRHDFSYYAIVAGQEVFLPDLKKLLAAGAHDYLTLPFDQEILKAKIQIASQIVTDRRTLAVSAQVMERYARYADKIAMEKTRQLSHAERLSTLGTMSAGLAHEINNPLGYITTSIETAQIYWNQLKPALEVENTTLENDALDRIKDRVPKAFERIQTGLARIDKLINSLKNFARESQGGKTLSDLNHCIRIALEMCDSTVKYHVSVKEDLCDDLPPISIEPQQIEQVLINLLVNAAHALEGKEAAEIYITSKKEADFIILTIADNGPGIPKSKLETIWQPYYTTKAEGKGTGLGLAISKSLIRDNGGAISVRNREEGGAEFTIKFPLL
jgi:C4-dicarboxylate-specific signal transduction histidine kinase